MLYIDITRLYNNSHLQYATGVDKVTLAYIRYLGKNNCAVIRYPKYWLFLPYTLSQTIFNSLLKGKKRQLSTLKLMKKINAIRYGKPIPKEKNFLLHTSHGGLEKPEFMEFMNKYQLQGIYFLHDLIPIDYPEFCRDGEKQKHHIRLKTMSQGELVICNSQYTLSRWQDYCRKNDLILPQSIFAHIAPDDKWQTENSDLNELLQLIVPKTPYFVILGTIEGRKNHLLLLNLWRELWREMGKNCPKLLIIGKRGWECEQVLDILDKSDELKNVLIEMNTVSDDEVRYILQSCQALLFPSFEEGYGLPLVEAFCGGTPVIASDIPAFREINFNNIIPLLSPINTLAWKNKIIDYCNNQHPERLEQIKKMATIQPALPIWEKHFNKVIPEIKKI